MTTARMRKNLDMFTFSCYNKTPVTYVTYKCTVFVTGT